MGKSPELCYLESLVYGNNYLPKIKFDEVYDTLINLSCEKPAMLCHYVSQEKSHFILDPKSDIYCGHASCQNDICEICTGCMGFVEYCQRQGAMPEEVIQSLAALLRSDLDGGVACKSWYRESSATYSPMMPYLFSMTPEINSSCQWKNYAGANKGGYCFCFDVAKLEEAIRKRRGRDAKSTLLLMRCFYEGQDDDIIKKIYSVLYKAIEPFLNHVAASADSMFMDEVGVEIRGAILTIATLIKHHKWTNEKEWRLLLIPGPRKLTKQYEESGLVTGNGHPIQFMRKILISPYGDVRALRDYLNGFKAIQGSHVEILDGALLERENHITNALWSLKEKKLQKLELTWIGKEKRPRLEPRVLVEDSAKSHHAATRRRDGKDIFDNMLIHGDNLLALKALEQQFVGKVKCIYIDPPYNTGAAYKYYNDGLEHSIWLGLMRERLELLKELLSQDGSIWISIDEKEGHYLKVLCDEIFGRDNFIIQTAIRRGAATGHKAINPTPVQVCDYMLTYAKDKDRWVYHPTYVKRGYDKAYNKYIPNINESYEKWKMVSLKDTLKKLSVSIDQLLKTSAAQIVRTAQPNYEAVGQEIRDLIDSSKAEPSKIFFKKRIGHPDIYLIGGERILFYKDKLRIIDGELVTAELVTNFWSDMNYQGIAKEGGVKFARSKKPESQIARLLAMSTMPGDLVLDSFLGSGTTAAVAHKMGRRWIGIELGDHCFALCKPRIDRVVDGKDETGITKKVGWKGGGGYRFFELAPTLITKDKWGQEVINKDYNPAMLAEAVCKLEGFTYAPSESEYFIHGHSTERAFIYVTTNFMRKGEIQDISEQVGEKRSLLICCRGFDKGVECRNLRLKKIPEAVLKKCEWGHDDYSLNVANLPMAQDEEYVQDDLFGEN